MWTSQQVDQAVQDGWATPGGVLPIACEYDLHQALLACARAPEEQQFGLLTHCFRRGSEMGITASSMRGLARRAKAVTRLWDPLLHPRGADGRFIEVGGMVRGYEGSDHVFTGRVSTIEHGRIEVADVTTGDTRWFSPDSIRQISVKTRTTRQPKRDLPADSGVNVLSRTMPIDTGEPHEWDSKALEQAAASIRAEREYLPVNLLDVGRVEVTMDTDPSLVAIRQQLEDAIEAREILEDLTLYNEDEQYLYARVAKLIRQKWEENGRMGREASMVVDIRPLLTDRQIYLLARHGGERRYPYAPLAEADLEEFSWDRLEQVVSYDWDASQDLRIRETSRQLELRENHLMSQYGGRPWHVPDVDDQDGGPGQTTLDQLATFERMGEQITRLVDQALIEEGYSIDMDDALSRGQFERRYVALHDAYNRLHEKAIATYADELIEAEARARGLWVEGTAPGSVDMENTFWAVVTHMIANGEPSDLFIQRAESFLPSDIGQSLSRLKQRRDRLTERGKIAGNFKGRRERDKRRAELTRQALREMGVAFGPPARSDPYLNVEQLKVGGSVRPVPGDVLWKTQYRGGEWAPTRYTVQQVTPGVNGDWSALVEAEDGSTTRFSQSSYGLFREIGPMEPARVRAMEDAWQMFPTEWLDSVWRNEPVVLVPERRRAARGAGALWFPRDGGPDYLAETMVHEEHHAVERANPWIPRMEWAFIGSLAYTGKPGERKARPGEGQPKQFRPTKLKTLFGYSGYKDDEWAIEDHLWNAYAGKVYAPGDWTGEYMGGRQSADMHYELLTMTAEAVLTGEAQSVHPDMVGTARRARDWYLGLVLASTTPGGFPQYPVSEAATATATMAARDVRSLGSTIPSTAKLPSERMDRLRRSGPRLDPKVYADLDTDVYTMTFTGPAGTQTSVWQVQPGRNPVLRNAVVVAPDGTETKQRLSDLERWIHDQEVEVAKQMVRGTE